MISFMPFPDFQHLILEVPTSLIRTHFVSWIPRSNIRTFFCSVQQVCSLCCLCSLHIIATFLPLVVVQLVFILLAVLSANSDRMLVMKAIDHLWAKDCSQSHNVEKGKHADVVFLISLGSC